MDETTQGFEEFAAAFGMEEDNQIPSEDVTEETDSTQTEQDGNDQEAAEESDSEETAESNENQNAEEVGAEGVQGGDGGALEADHLLAAAHISLRRQKRQLKLPHGRFFGEQPSDGKEKRH